MSFEIKMLLTAFMSFIIVIALGPVVIPFLRRLKVGQSIRQEGPQSHLEKKGTPVMGGIMTLTSLTVVCLFSGYLNKEMMFMLLSTLGFGLIGFLDDYIKVVLKRSLGLKAMQKIIGQCVVTVLMIVFFVTNYENPYQIIVPFVDGGINMGLLYIPFIFIAIIATTNSTNLTDGVDGLASSVTVVVMAFLAAIAYKMNNYTVAIFCVSLAAALIGFLKYNFHPAQVFMGDLGSLALGGAVASVCVILKLPILIPILGLIYFAEALSVIIQVTYFKKTGKRVFKMSPIHHHFELSGWSEKKVVFVFSFVTLVMGTISYASLTL